MARCANCKFFARRDGTMEGSCGYTPPPAVRAIYDMLHAEPSTHINWRIRLNEPFVTDEVSYCSEHQPIAK